MRLVWIPLVAILVGCGGGSGSSGGNTPPPVVTITISPTTASVEVGGSSQSFTVTVTGTANTTFACSVNGVVNGNATVGTVATSSTNCAYTPPAAMPNPATVTVTATSSADATKSASATVAITAAQSSTPTITSVVVKGTAPGTMFHGDNEYQMGLLDVQIAGSFPANTTLVTSGYPDLAIGNQTATTQVEIGQAFDTPHFAPRRISYQSCTTDKSVCGNPFLFSFGGDQNTAQYELGTNYLIQLQQGNPYAMYEFSNGVEAGTFVGEFTGGTPWPGGQSCAAIDNKTGFVVLVSYNPIAVAVFKQDGTYVGAVPTSTRAQGCAARDGVASFTQPGTGSFIFDISKVNGTSPIQIQIAGGTGSWSLTMSNGVGTDEVYVYDREATTVYPTTVSIPAGGTLQAVPGTPLKLNEFTPAAQLQAAFPFVGGWYVGAFDMNSPNVGTVVVMGPHLNANNTINFALARIDGTTMTEIGAATALPQSSFRLAADQTHGVAVVASDDGILTHLTKVDPSTGVATSLTTTSPKLGVGLAISPDGTTVAICEQSGCDFLPNK